MSLMKCMLCCGPCYTFIIRFHQVHGITVATHTTFCKHRFFASLIRPFDVVDVGLRIYHDSNYLFFVSYSPSLRNGNCKSCQMFRSECNLTLHVHNMGFPFSVKTRAQKPPIFDVFRPLLNLIANLTAVAAISVGDWGERCRRFG